MAQQIARELVQNGRLLNLENYGDHLARYGKGFSQMLSIAGDQRQAPPATSHQTGSPTRLMEGYSSAGQPHPPHAITEQEAAGLVLSQQSAVEAAEQASARAKGEIAMEATTPFAMSLVSPRKVH